MFQWVEESVERIGSMPPQDVMDHDERTYYYTTEWREKLVDSTHFYLRSGHQNPPSFPIEPMTYLAEHVKIGEVELSEDIKKSFSNFILITSDTRPDVPGVKLHSGFYYHTDNIHEPAVGDVRLQFLLAGLEGTSYTVVGKLNESGVLEPYHSKFGQQVLIVKSGELSVEEVLSQEKFVLSINSWLMRALGTGLLFIAISRLTEVLAESRKKNVGNYNSDIFYNLFVLIVSGFPGSNINFSVLRSFRWKSVRLSFTLATALLVLAIVWSIHKPLTGVGMLFCAALLYIFCVKTMQN